MWRIDYGTKNVLFYLFQITSFMRAFEYIYYIFYRNISVHLVFIIFINVFYKFSVHFYFNFMIPYSFIHYCYKISILQTIINTLLFWEFFTLAFADSFLLELEWHKYPRVFPMILSILANLINAVVWIVSTHPLIPSPPVPLPVLWWRYRAQQLELVSLSLSSCLILSVL